jgi:hypothetical protein
MLHEFLTSNRSNLIARCRAKVALRTPGAPPRELQHGITPFLDQLILTMRLEQKDDDAGSLAMSGPSSGQARSEIGDTAHQHGRELLQHGYSIDEVVHDYGDLCQAITDLAFERGINIDTDEFRTVNRCLDNAIAGAVSAFASRSDSQRAEDSTQRLGAFAHELRNLVATATLAMKVIRTGNVGLTGATGQMLERSLDSLATLIDAALAEVRAGSSPAAASATPILPAAP